MAKLDTLVALAQTVNKNKVKNIQVIGNNPNSMSKMDVFYRALAEGKYESEEEAAEDLYGAGPDHGAYRKLKERVEERLSNTLFLIDNNEPNYSDLQKAYYSCYKNASAIKILIGKQNRQGAIPLAVKTLKVAEKYEFTDIVLALTKELRTHYGMIIGNKKKFDYYNKRVKHYTQLYQAEISAEEYCTTLIVHLSNSTEIKKSLIAVAENFTKELLDMSVNINSYWFNYFTYVLITIRYEIVNDYKNVIKFCQTAMNYFESRKHLTSNRTLFQFRFRALGGHIKLKQYNIGLHKTQECIKLTLTGSINWYSSLHYLMLFSYHSSNFDQAYSTFVNATSHPNFKVYFRNLAEQWSIHEAFIFYFLLTKKLNADKNEGLSRFRLSKFLNEVPTFSKDKRGNNITIIILQILFLLQQRKYGAIIDKMESLQTYTHRYLRQDDTFRSNCFIKMLLCLPAASFYKREVIKRAEKYWTKLQSVPIEKANQSADLEIVPYEMLWEFVLEGLDEKWH